MGIAVLEKLIDKEHPNLYYSIKGTHEYINEQEANQRSNSIVGFSTTLKTRPLIIAKAEEFVRNKLIKLNSARLYNEMTTFIWHNGRPEAQRSYNDDLIMALAISCWVRDTALVVNQRELEYRKAMMSAMSISNSSLDTRMSGMIGYKKAQDSFTRDAATNLQMEYAALIKG